MPGEPIDALYRAKINAQCAQKCCNNAWEADSSDAMMGNLIQGIGHLARCLAELCDHLREQQRDWR